MVEATKNHLLGEFFIKRSSMYAFFFGLYPLLIAPLIWPYSLKTPQERLGLLLLAGLLALAPFTGFLYHYAAAIMPVLYLRFLHTAGRLMDWQSPRAAWLGIALAAFFLILIPFQFVQDLGKPWKDGEYAPPLAFARESVVRALAAQPGRQLVLVRYAPSHNAPGAIRFPSCAERWTAFAPARKSN